MKESMKDIIKKGVHFFFTSGLGFIIDFCIYTLLIRCLGFGVMGANFISSVAGSAFVFFVSTHRIFSKGTGKLPYAAKYAVYILYQLCLITIASRTGALINEVIYNNIAFMASYSKFMAKVFITPFTMVCNFVVCRYLAEKL